MMSYLSVLFCFNILLIFVNQSSAEFGLEYIPPSKIVDIIEGRSYTIGVEEDGKSTNITRCYYKSNTGHDDYFDVIKRAPPEESLAKSHLNTTTSNDDVRETHNEIKHNGQAGWCQMTVNWVDDSGPTKWTMTPVNNKTGETPQNLTEITYKVNFFYKVQLLSENIIATESESFFQYMIVTSVNLQSCMLRFKDTDVNLDLQSTKTKVFLKPRFLRNEGTLSKISSFGRGLCGFKVQNVTTAESLEWTLTATDEEGKSYRAIFKSTVFAKMDETVLNIKQAVVVGERAFIKCGDDYQNMFCIMYNPVGKLMYTKKNNCQHRINIVGMEDLGTWRCDVTNTLSMKSIRYTVQVFGEVEEEELQTWVEETENHINIGCRRPNSLSSILLCKMIAPNGLIFTPKSGVATSRYLSIGTDFATATCAMEIPKPLLDFEHGMWRCEIGPGNIVDDVNGRFISVGQAKAPQFQKHFKLTAQLGEPLTIFCEIPFPSEYCYFKSPNGTQYLGENENRIYLGRCLLEIGGVIPTDNGTWTCLFAREIGVPDEEITIEVTIAEVLTFYRNAEVDAGDTAQLLCSSGGLPLKFCRFISPNGQSYFIPNHHKSDFLSYYGRGLEYGDCGISISNANSSHSGPWRCITRIGKQLKNGQAPEISADINLEVNNSNVASAIGIAVGVVVVTSIAVAIGVSVWKKRGYRETEDGPVIAARNINDAEDNTEIDIFNVGPAPRSYTNPTDVEVDPHEHQL